VNETPYSPEPALEAPEATDLRDYLALLRRRWWLVALSAAGVLASGAWVQHRKPELYTAKVLLQREAQRSPLDPLGGALGLTSPSEAVSSQIEILRSDAVLSAVVDSLKLRLQIYGSRVRRSDILAAAEVARDAPRARYLLASEGGEFVLRDRGSGTLVARAPSGKPLQAPGLRLVLARAAALDGPVGVAVVLQQEAIAALRNEVKLTQVRGTAIIRAEYTSPDPVLAAAVVNTLAGSYQRYMALRARAEATRRREFIAAQVAKVADSLAAAQELLSSYQERSRTLDPAIEASAMAAALMDAEKDLQTLRFQQGLLASLLIALRAGQAADQGFQRIAALGSDLLPGGAEMYRQLQELETERRRLTASRYGYLEGGPAVEVIDSLIAATREDIRGIAQQSLEVLQSKLQAAEARLRELRAEAGELPARATEFTRLREAVDAIQNIFGMLVQKYQEAQIAEAVEAGDVKVIDSAAVPEFPNESGLGRNLLLSLMLGVMLGVGLVFAVEHFDTTVRDRLAAEQASGLRVLALVPELKAGARGTPVPVVVNARDPRRGAEVFRMLRTTLRFARQKRPQLLLIVSPGPAEGKTTVAVNLALALAQQGGRTLLLDGDLRRPSLHEVFAMQPAPGLSDVLVGEASLAQALNSMPEAGLTLLPAGTVVPNPAEFLGGEGFAQFLKSVRENFETVVIDAAPVLAAAETVVASAGVDGVLVVVRAGYTDRTALARAVEHLRQVEAPVLGIVLNRLPLMGAQKRYGYYEYYGYYEDGAGGRGERRGWAARLLRLRAQRMSRREVQ